mgnify:CR=1 FL=1
MGVGEKERVDGRRERSRTSHARIVSAMLALIENGHASPSAAQVATEAGVGLRTVFRHFEDMDTLYREMYAAIGARAFPFVQRPFVSDNWRDRLQEIAARRATVFEMILPYRITLNIKRFNSDFLMRTYRDILTLERSLVETVLPDAVKEDSLSVEALHVALGFQTWRQLRHDTHLSASRAQEVVAAMLEALLTRLSRIP